MIYTRFGTVAALHIRRCAAENKEGVGRSAAVLGSVPGMVTRGVLGFIGILLLLIDNDEAEIAARSKYGAPRTDHNACPAGFDALPLVVALPCPQRAVEHRNIISEVGGKNSQQLRGQGDLRHQNHSGSAPFQLLPDQSNIDQGLAASGHTVQQGRSRLFLL